MFKILMDTISSNRIPSGVASGLDFDTAAFIFGMVVGAIITLLFIGIVKYVKFLIKENKELEEKLNSKESH